MSRRRLKAGEKSTTFAVSLSESELALFDAECRKYDIFLSSEEGDRGNRSAFVRRMLLVWSRLSRPVQLILSDPNATQIETDTWHIVGCVKPAATNEDEEKRKAS
jgi:hypothetical protein